MLNPNKNCYLSDREWKFYRKQIPVLNQAGWYYTGATGSHGVWFRNSVYKNEYNTEIELEITIGIAFAPQGRYGYCANWSTQYSSAGFDIPDVRLFETPWEEVKSYCILKGLEAYDIYLKDLHDRIESDFGKGKIK